MVAGGDPANCLAKPAQRAVVGEHEGLVDSVVDALGAALDFAGERFLRRCVQGFLGFALCGRIWRKPESMQEPDMLALDKNVSRIRDLGFKHCVLSQSTHQDAGSAVDKPVGQPFV